MIAFTAEVTGETPAVWKPMFNGVLAKPIIPADLLLLLATCRSGSQSGPAGSSERGPS
jgi:hypothetical protein